jgi:hypothetical protein
MAGFMGGGRIHGAEAFQNEHRATLPATPKADADEKQTSDAPTGDAHPAPEAFSPFSVV